MPQTTEQEILSDDNRYSDLDPDSDLENDSMTNSMEYSETKKPRLPKIPPLILRDIEDWTSLSKELKNNCTAKFSAKLSGETIRLNLTSIEDFRKTTKLLTSSGIQYFTYQLKVDKKIVVVIRGLHNKVKPDDLAEDLVAQGIPATAADIKQICNIKTGVAYPLYLVKVPRTDVGKRIWQVTHVLNMVVTMESQRKRAGPIQCYKCQRWNHGQTCCFNTPRCMKCAGSHLTYLCPKKKEDGPARCCNCLEEHTANYRGCKAYPKRAPPQQMENPQVSCSITTRPETIAVPDLSKDFPALPTKSTSQSIVSSAPVVEEISPELSVQNKEQSSAQPELSSTKSLEDLFGIINVLKNYNVTEIISKVKIFLDKFLVAKTWQEKLSVLSEAYTVISPLLSTLSSD